jgi:hypothetical protein
MNREIKFKFWCTSENRFVTGVSLHGDGQITCPDGIAGTDTCNDVIPLQYTGCKDGNGQEIYEGDILKYKNRNGKVEFFAGAFYCCWDDQTDDQLSYMMIDDMRVIGNVFEYKK